VTVSRIEKATERVLVGLVGELQAIAAAQVK
jgi:hypothetical protein